MLSSSSLAGWCYSNIYCRRVVLYMVGCIFKAHCSKVTLHHWISHVGYDLVLVDPSHLSGLRPSVLNLSIKSFSLKAVDQSELQLFIEQLQTGAFHGYCLVTIEMHQEQPVEINSSFTLQWDNTVFVLVLLFFVLLYTVILYLYCVLRCILYLYCVLLTVTHIWYLLLASH